MGIFSSQTNIQTERQHLWIGTLNYSGILKSPFQFYGDQKNDPLSNISKIFRETASQYWKDFVQTNVVYKIFTQQFEKDDKPAKWPIGKIDRIFQDRYSPLYDSECGIDEFDLLDNIVEFQKKWRERYGQIKKKEKNLLKPRNLDFEEKQIEMAIIFDYACYISILIYLFTPFLSSTQSREERQKIIDNLTVEDGKKYKKFMRRSFSKSFIKSDQKIKKTINMLRRCDLDVLFLQQIDRDLLKAIQKNFLHYRVSHSGDMQTCTSAILINQKAFPQLNTKSLKMENLRFFKNQNLIFRKQDREKYHVFNKQEFQQLNVNGKTVVQIVDKFIFISGHLTSKKNHQLQIQNNDYQIKQLKNILKKLKQTYGTFQIICGFDINSQLDCSDLEDIGFPYYYPQSDQLKTVKKKRTYLQPQIGKAEVLDNKKKDYLISTVKISYPKILTIKDVESHIQNVDLGGENRGLLTRRKSVIDPSLLEYFLPTDEHPYDHFILVGKVENFQNYKEQALSRKKGSSSPKKMKLSPAKMKKKVQKTQSNQQKDEKQQKIALKKVKSTQQKKERKKKSVKIEQKDQETKDLLNSSQLKNQQMQELLSLLSPTTIKKKKSKKQKSK